MSIASIAIGPEHNGQPMSLEEFENAEVQEGYLYELGRGVVVVNEVPNPSHLDQLDDIGRQLGEYRPSSSLKYMRIAGGSDCKILIESLGSHRHPDCAIYLTPRPSGLQESQVWASWIPEIVIEVVSPSSRHRDYHEKREEYLQFGIQEYWIVDADLQRLTVLQRSDDKWDEHRVQPPAKHATHLLPGFELDITAVFAAAAGA